ncbi:hypothetical protein GYMLUDRAFT_245878 [Collybiopsis luxurians FD-317 M1]|uniref:Uncharacterized protein n=1 Tax=Collybiopsis luxurians FD-317 M1 TaxID=944289 RepID=A0A0D0CSV9_9AGAR|nr:hypothetical protein GYMLUDRAFT_245878 [Collybiopsis luxurians FD-317 M1]
MYEGVQELLCLPDQLDGKLATDKELLLVAVHGDVHEMDDCDISLEISLPVISSDDRSTRHWSEPTFSEQQLLHIYHVATLLICEAAATWSLNELEKLHLRPSRMLGLALTLGVRRWLTPAMESLFARQAFLYSAGERAEMEFEAASVLANAQFYLLKESVNRASVPPPVNFGFGAQECPYQGYNHDKSPCAAKWDQIWWDKVGQKLVHPDSPLPFGEATDYTKKIDSPVQGHSDQGCCRGVH